MTRRKLIFWLLLLTIVLVMVTSKSWKRTELTRDESPSNSTPHLASDSFKYPGPSLVRQRCLPLSQSRQYKTLPEDIKFWQRSKDELCRFLFKHFFDRLFSIQVEHSPVLLSPQMRNHVSKWLGGNADLLEELTNQTVMVVSNKITGQSNIYNSIRGNRPVADQKASLELYIDSVVKESKKSCDFCRGGYINSTLEDSFGRLESKYAYTASNVFKLGAWHSMVILRDHHPLEWEPEFVEDALTLAETWFQKVHELDARYRFPVILWDLMPKAGASQIHPHFHVLISRFGHLGELGQWVAQVEKFHAPSFIPWSSCEKAGGSYFGSLARVHEILELVSYLPHPHSHSTFILPSLTPIRDYETLIVSKNFSQAAWQTIAILTRAFVESLHQSAFSLAVAIPDLSEKSDSKLPLYGRIVGRGDASELRSDATSLELFAAANVNTDPYRVVEAFDRTAQFYYSPAENPIILE